MKRVSAIKALLADCTEEEVCAVIGGILNAEWVNVSDRFADAFSDTFKAFDREWALWDAYADWRRTFGEAA